MIQPQYRIYSKYNLLDGFKISLIKNHRENQIPIIILRIGLKLAKNSLKKKFLPFRL